DRFDVLAGWRSADGVYVAADTIDEDLLPARLDERLRPVRVDRVERPRLQDVGDPLHCTRVKGNEVWIAPHEAHRLVRPDDLDGIARQQRALSTGARRPVQHSGAGVVPAYVYQRHAREDLFCLPFPKFDRGV